MSRYFTRANLVLAAIIALAAFFRFYRIEQLPPGFQFDQAFYVLDALKLLQGEFAIFFYQPGRSEPLYQYLLMPFVALFGADSPLGLKITGGIISILTIPLVYGITYTIFSSVPPRDDRKSDSVRIAMLTAFFTAISFWHIFYARYGERIPLTLLMAILAFWFLWRALTVESSKQSQMFLYAGFFTGLTLYTYPAGRIVPVAMTLLVAYAILTDRARAGEYFKGFVIVAAMTILVFLPLGIYYLEHPIDFISHTADVSIFVPHGVVSDNVPLELGKNVLKVLGMFFIVGDSGVLRNLPYRPIFDPFTGALFVIGAIVWLVHLFAPKSTRLERFRAVFLAVWLGLALALSIISDDAPNNGRVLIGLPVVMILPAWGAVAIWNRLHSPVTRRGAVAVMGAIIVISTTLVYRDMFVVLANDPGTYYAFDTDKVELADWLKQNASDNHLFVAPLLAQNGTLSLLTRNTPLKSFESRDTIVLPGNASGKDALFVFPWEQEKKLQTMTERLGVLGAQDDDITGSNSGKLALVYRVPVQSLPDALNPIVTLMRGGDFVKRQKTEHAMWNDSFELLGYSIEAADSAKRNLEVTLFFHVLKQMSDDYTFSVKVRDAKDRVWGQEDKWAGNNSYATTQWSPGDVIIEKFYPGLNACTPTGEYYITVEAYNPNTMQVLALSNRAGNNVPLGTTDAETSPGNLYDHLEPEQTIDVQVAPQVRLMGYTLTRDPVRIGDSFSLSLFWRGAGDGKQIRSAIKLRDSSNRDFILNDLSAALPAEGRGLCTFFDFKIPSDAKIGLGSIWVNDTKIATIQVER